MVSNSNQNRQDYLVNSRYLLATYDDFGGKYGGSYFRIIKVNNNTPRNSSLDTYELTVGFPDSDFITGFSIQNNETYSILYDYGETMHQEQFEYRIGDDGKIEQIYSPQVATNTALHKATASERAWWSSMTQFPVSGTVTIKGLMRPAILMSYVRIHVYFYGRKHISSGLYIITGQQDSISASGFTTTLNITRVGGDE